MIFPNGNYSDVSARIKQVRGELKKSKFADLLGISRPNLSRYEAGRMPPADVMQKIADYGGVSVKWLLTGKEEKKYVKQDLPPEPPADILPPVGTVEIQEFLLAQVLRAIEEYWGDTDPGLDHRARLITALYNHCARTLEPPDYGLVEKFDTDLA